MLRFARDVGINVLANLIAAAVIYVFGWWAGVWLSRELLIGATVTLAVAAATAALVLVLRTPAEDGQRFGVGQRG